MSSTSYTVYTLEYISGDKTHGYIEGEKKGSGAELVNKWYYPIYPLSSYSKHKHIYGGSKKSHNKEIYCIQHSKNFIFSHYSY